MAGAQVSGGAPAARAELIATYLLADRTEDVQTEAQGFGVDPATAAALPAWARDTLRDPVLSQTTKMDRIAGAAIFSDRRMKR